MSKLESPPPGVLSPIDQGMFALGYYHQLNDRFRGISEHKAETAAKAAAADGSLAS
jgi:hypothetical protein